MSEQQARRPGTEDRAGRPEVGDGRRTRLTEQGREERRCVGEGGLAGTGPGRGTTSGEIPGDIGSRRGGEWTDGGSENRKIKTAWIDCRKLSAPTQTTAVTLLVRCTPQQPSQKPSVTRHNRTLSPAERGRVGSGCGMGQQCARASGEPSWACASRAVYVCRPASATRATAQI